ncbi:MAG: hypothetical protein OEZ32_06855 [Nitrospinota bacterium]|nr:hypothetical protein [Nitrospinota bacterium]
MKKFIFIALSVVVAMAFCASLSYAQKVVEYDPVTMPVPEFGPSEPSTDIRELQSPIGRTAPIIPRKNSGNANEKPVYAPSPVVVSVGEREQTQLLQAKGPLFSAIKMLEKEIRRDKVLVEGEMTADNLENTRVALDRDLKSKVEILSELEKESGDSLASAIDLIRKTVESEERIIASRSSIIKKRRQVHRRLETNIPVKEEALSLLKKEIGE